MNIYNSINKLRARLDCARKKKNSIGLVPTMGALHAGHAALIRKCKKENDLTVLSVFINPSQFGPREDFSNYPRRKKTDVLLAKGENVDIIFCPSIKNIYPPGYLTYIEIERLSERLCGRSRPGHFKGVATIVAKLINIVQPDTLYLGQKDAQQCVILKQMVRDLNLRCHLRICPTVRDRDGLALSSRNAYLSAKERCQARVLFDALKLAKRHLKQGERRGEVITKIMRELILANGPWHIDYIYCVNAKTLEKLNIIKGQCLIALAARIGATRLIDNIIVFVK